MAGWRGQYWRGVPERADASDGSLKLVSDPALAITLADALFHLRIDAGLEDDYVSTLIEVVQAQLQPPTGWLGRAITESEFELTLPCFARRIVLPAPPLISVDSIEYRDTSNQVQTVDPDLYRITQEEVASIVLLDGKSWPDDVSYNHDAVTIKFTAGYTEVPKPIIQYMLMMIAHLYDMRQPAVVGTIVADTPYFRSMLENWRVRV